MENGYFRCGAGVGGVNITGGQNDVGGGNVVGGGTVCDLVTLCISKKKSASRRISKRPDVRDRPMRPMRPDVTSITFHLPNSSSLAITSCC